MKITLKKLMLILIFVFILLSSCTNDKDPGPIPEPYFPILEVSGTYYEIGYEIGKEFTYQIEKAFEGLQDIYAVVDDLIAIDTVKYYTQYVDTVNETFPQFIQELEGMADGSGQPFRKFFISSMLSEYAHLLGMKSNENLLGCSTVSFVKDGKLYLAHNEDGKYILKDLIFIVKAHPVDKPSFISFVLPGLVLSVGPAMNDAGIFYSGNYVSGTEFKEGGIPYAFIERSLMEAVNIDDAIAKATIPGRAYCYHINIASKEDKKIVSLEVTPSTYFLEEVDGFFVHTNHFIQPGMIEFTHTNENSVSRFDVLKTLSGNYENKMDEVTGDLLTGFLSSHDQWINSPCSHGNAENGISATLGSTLFDVANGTWRISYNNPCEGKFQYVEF